MSVHFTQIAQQAIAEGVIGAEDILNLRRAGWADGRIAPEEADALFAINRRLSRPDLAWTDFFVEAVSEYVVNGIEPRGYVTQANADWLVRHIAEDGRLESMAELEALVRIFERALNVPESLRAFASAEIERAVLTGEGPTRCGGQLEKGNVTRAEASILRRILFASGSERPAAISRAEAELLFRIKDATLDAENAPEWKRLFVQGVGNYLQGFTSYEPLPRDRAAQLEAFMNDRTSSVGRFMGRMARAATHPNVFGVVFGRREPGPAIEALAAQAHKVTEDEAQWLDERIEANGTVDAYDRALLDFLADESAAQAARVRR